MNETIKIKVSEASNVRLKYTEAITKPEVVKTVTPTYEGLEVLPPSGATLSKVIVEPIPDPVEEIYISENDNYDVSRIGVAHVNVPQGIFPSGTKHINIHHNGTTLHDVREYETSEIFVNTDPEKGILFDDFDNDGFPTKARVIGEWSGEFPTFRECFGTNTSYLKKISSFVIPEGVTVLGPASFYNCTNLQNIVLPSTLTKIKGQYNFYNVTCDIIVPESFSEWESNSQFAYCKAKKIIFLGNVPDTPNSCFSNATNVELYDFSHCTAVPALYSVASFGHKNGCVIRIPYALSDEARGVGNGWQSKQYWNSLTNIVWEVIGND